MYMTRWTVGVIHIPAPAVTRTCRYASRPIAVRVTSPTRLALRSGALGLPTARAGTRPLTYSLTPAVPGLSFDATERRLTGTPLGAGTFDMTYTVTDAGGESATLTFTITVTEPADLVVESVSISDSSPNAGALLTLSATVRNRGNGPSESTRLRFYRSSDATISPNDTPLSSRGVSGLPPSGTSAESIRHGAPSSAGTYYYGACVSSVPGESDTENNCSSAVRVTVSGGTDPPEPGAYQPLAGLRVLQGGSVQYTAGGVFQSAGPGQCIQLSGGSINGVTYTSHSSKWQRRDGYGSPWQDVPGTERQGGLCGYNPTTAGEYRLVADMTIGGRRGNYSSENTIRVN